MAILNFIGDSNLTTIYPDYFRGKEAVPFSECFAVGSIPIDIFQSVFAEKMRIASIDRAFNKNCSSTYHKIMSQFLEIDYSKYTGVELFFQEDMSSIINLLAILYNLDLLRRKGFIDESLTLKINIYKLNRNKDIKDSFVYSRYISSVELEDLSMTFFNLIKAQDEVLTPPLLDKICERISQNYPSMRESIRNYYYIRTPEFKEKCKRNSFESDFDYSRRMTKENASLGLSKAFYLNL